LKILLDQNAPAPLARFLPGHGVTHTSALGWEELTNGDLLAAAESDGFELFVTADKNIRYQQNLAERTIALIVLSTNDWPTVRGQLDLVANAVNASRPGSYKEVALTPRPLVRRPYNPPGS
jgi:predicted nuclease of predicted toxin-antitoxin system